MKSRTIVLAACIGLLGIGGLTACEKQGPAEKVGEKIDHGVDTVKNGGKEPVGDKIEDAAHDARDGVSDAAKDLKN